MHTEFLIKSVLFVSFRLLHFKRFPFDCSNPIGYLVAVILEYVAFGYNYVVIASTLSFGIGLYRLAISSTKDFQDFLRIINDNAHTNQNQSNELEVLFAEYVDTHATIKQLSINHTVGAFNHRFIYASTTAFFPPE